MSISKSLRFALVSLAAPVVLGAAMVLAAPAAAPKGNPVSGKALFVKCVQCHKADGTGGVKLTGNPTPKLARQEADGDHQG